MAYQSQVLEALTNLEAASFLQGAARKVTEVALTCDQAIATYRSADGLVLSAISDRKFLAWVLEALGPIPGRQVFEIGSGTGYLAAVLGQLCGAGGRVLGCEIIPELHCVSLKNLGSVRIANVELSLGDFVDVLPTAGTFDVLIATSCFSKIHPHILDAIRVDGGLLALPVEVPGGGDCFTVFERTVDALVVRDGRLSISVPSTGSYTERPFWARPVDQVLPGFSTLAKTTLPFQGGIESVDPIRDTLAFRSYLLFHEPLFEAVSLGRQQPLRARDMAFGLIDPRNCSACLQHGASWAMVGKDGLALARLFAEHWSRWLLSGKRSLADYKYSIALRGEHGVPLRPALKDLLSDAR
jgi:protein-L-isoaspartate O-methyltransferase